MKFLQIYKKNSEYHNSSLKKIPPIFTDGRGSVILNIKKKKIYYLRVENGAKIQKTAHPDED